MMFVRRTYCTLVHDFTELTSFKITASHIFLTLPLMFYVLICNQEFSRSPTQSKTIFIRIVFQFSFLFFSHCLSPSICHITFAFPSAFISSSLTLSYNSIELPLFSLSQNIFFRLCVCSSSVRSYEINLLSSVISYLILFSQSFLSPYSICCNNKLVFKSIFYQSFLLWFETSLFSSTKANPYFSRARKSPIFLMSSNVFSVT